MDSTLLTALLACQALLFTGFTAIFSLYATLRRDEYPLSTFQNLSWIAKSVAIIVIICSIISCLVIYQMWSSTESILYKGVLFLLMIIMLFIPFPTIMLSKDMR